MNGRDITQSTPDRRWVDVVLFAAVLLFSAQCAGSNGADRSELVGQGVSEQVRQTARAHQRSMIQQLAQFSLQHDRRVCRAVAQRRDQKRQGRAVSEAYLEVHGALDRARDTSSWDREDERIEWMLDEADDGAVEPSWRCLRLSAHRTCVRSAANSVAKRYFRAHIPGHLDPEVTAEVTDVVVDEFAWALGLLVTHTRAEEALLTIEHRCEAGQSPLAQFLDDVPDDRQLQFAARQVRDRLGADQIGTCPAVAAMHEQLVDTMRRAVVDRLERVKSCRIESWEPLGR